MTRGSRWPSLIAANWRAKAEATNVSDWPGPVWLNGRTRTTWHCRLAAKW